MRGFSLLEMMIVLFIMALLTAISIPVYSSFLTHQNRVAAEITLLKVGAQLEKYYLQNNSYENATLEALGFSALTADNSYRISIVTADNIKFVLQAVPEGKQEKDVACGTLTLNSKGEKGVADTGNVKDCWG